MQITYLPYLLMDNHEEIIIFKDALGITIWNYSKKADEYIADTALRTTIDGLMATNVASKGRPITDMGIISVGNTDFRAYSQEEKALCAETALLLFAGSLTRGGVARRAANAGFLMATSENFTVVEQNFEPDGDGIAIQDGYVVRMLIGGYRANEVTFQRPYYTPSSADTTGDGRLIRDLLKMRTKQKRLYRRIYRALEMFRQAYFNDTKLTEESRILSITSAYEILFDLPESRQRERLKQDFQRLFVSPNDRKKRYKSQRGSGVPVWETDSIKVMWADKFYTLRNKIIHGERLKRTDFVFCGKQRHFEIATLFFVLGIKKIIGSTSTIPDTTDEIMWEKYHDDNGEQDYEGFVYSRLDPIAAMLAGLRRR